MHEQNISKAEIPKRFKISPKPLFIWTLVLLATSVAQGESVYDQPWLGEWPEFWQRFANRQLEDIAGAVKKADLIVVATAGELKESQDADGHTFYESDVRVTETIKGKPADLMDRLFHLTWRAYTTDIESGARHVFFLKMRDNNEPQVLKSCYIYDEPTYPNKMRLIGAMNCDADLGMDVLRYLVTGKTQNLSDRLLAAYQSEQMYSVVVMACAVDGKIGLPVLKKVVAVDEPKAFDLNLYRAAVYRLAEVDKNEGITTILAGLPNATGVSGVGRLPESIAFSAVEEFGNKAAVPIIQQAVKDNPDWAVSAAFALMQIGTLEARAAIQEWRDDPSLASRKTRISDGGFGTIRTFEKLFDDALNQGTNDRANN